jgi:hypothetical protein
MIIGTFIKNWPPIKAVVSYTKNLPYKHIILDMSDEPTLKSEGNIVVYHRPGPWNMMKQVYDLSGILLEEDQNEQKFLFLEGDVFLDEATAKKIASLELKDYSYYFQYIETRPSETAHQREGDRTTHTVLFSRPTLEAYHYALGTIRDYPNIHRGLDLILKFVTHTNKHPTIRVVHDTHDDELRHQYTHDDRHLQDNGRTFVEQSMKYAQRLRPLYEAKLKELISKQGKTHKERMSSSLAQQSGSLGNIVREVIAFFTGRS